MQINIVLLSISPKSSVKYKRGTMLLPQIVTQAETWWVTLNSEEVFDILMLASEILWFNLLCRHYGEWVSVVATQQITGHLQTSLWWQLNALVVTTKKETNKTLHTPENTTNKHKNLPQLTQNTTVPEPTWGLVATAHAIKQTTLPNVQMTCQWTKSNFCVCILSAHFSASRSLAGQYTLSQKKVPTFKLSVNLSYLNRFSKLSHCWKAYEICYKTHMTSPISP